MELVSQLVFNTCQNPKVGSNKSEGMNYQKELRKTGYECDCQCDENQHQIPDNVAKKSVPPEITVYESRLCIRNIISHTYIFTCVPQRSS